MSRDLLLDDPFQLISRANGDAALVEGDACDLQTLRIEATACAGELWYAPTWGWSMLDFKGRIQDELTALEIESRVRQKLAAHEEIEVGSIAVEAVWEADSILVEARFRLLRADELSQLNLRIGRTEVEVIPIAE